MTERMERELSNIKSFSRRRQTVDLAELDLVKYSQLDPAQPMPLVIQPNLDDIDLAGWTADNRGIVDTKLRQHGALLFRGFGVKSVSEFERFAGVACDQLFSDYGDLPREEEGVRVYHSTPYPEEKTILFHNESSHQHRWPMKQFFYCVTPAEQGGQTPIVDCRRMYTELPRDIVERFAQKKLMYVRNFTEGLDVSWQEFFRTDDRARVEAYCNKAGMEFEWKPDGLRTRQICPAVAKHPITGEMIFFNQIQLHHIACLDPEVREALLSLFTLENLPRNVLYGDGTPIEDSVVETVSEVYWRTAVEFLWQAGDVIMLDNMLTAHARRPYRGARKIVVAMGDMMNASEL